MAIRISRRGFVRGAMLAPGVARCAGQAGSLTEELRNPPASSQPWIYWWWLDGAATKEGITADLEELKKRGVCGVLLFDAGYGGPLAPKGHLFMSDAWRENFRHAVREAARLDLEMGVDLCSGWDAGGPWVPPEHAIKALVWAEARVEGPRRWDGALPQPEIRHDWYLDIAVLACREQPGASWSSRETVDLTGAARWNVPEGVWTVLRIGYTLSGKRISLSSSLEAQGYEIDPLSAEAMDLHFSETASKLIADAGPLAGKTFKYTHIDSWEIGRTDWTANFLEEFRKRRGYDPLKYLPALAKKVVDAREITERFLWDYRRTTADLIAQNYYGRLSALSKEHGLGIHAESGGPFFSHNVDGLECEGIDDIPMGEFWLDQSRYNSLRQAVSATHVYGKPLCHAESFTANSDDYSVDPFGLKMQGDRAFANGLMRAVLHQFVQQPRLDIKPGYRWVHIGTSFDRNQTWWSKSGAWLRYLTRCQHMLRQGMFVADILYFSGEAIPNFVLFEEKIPAGHNFDVINAQALLARTSARDGRIVLPDGMSYRYLVIIDQKLGASSKPSPEAMTPRVLRKLRELVEAGATLVGPRPLHAPGLTGYPACDEDLKALADALWGPGESGERRAGKGRVIWGKPIEEVLRSDGVHPDVEFAGGGEFAWIHRHSSDSEIYFVANQSAKPAAADAVFRVSAMAPELWDPVTGETRPLPEFKQQAGRTSVPLRFEPFQSFFIVFARSRRFSAARNFPELRAAFEIAGPWAVAFDPKWGGPASVQFDHLQDWTTRPEEGIRYYSGTAVYRARFDLPAQAGRRVYLDLGTVKNLAEVKLNGKGLGVLWCAPWRVDITSAAKAGRNDLTIEIVNLWPNRLIGDGLLPKEQRRTVTNVATYDPVLPDWLNLRGCPICTERKKTGQPAKLLPSGLLGPVTVLLESITPLHSLDHE